MYGPLNDEIRRTLPAHVAAAHQLSAKGWVESIGFKYYAAHNKEDVIVGVKHLVEDKEEVPMMLEVFTTINTDINSIREYYSQINRMTYKDELVSRCKAKMKAVLPSSVYNSIKTIARK